MKTIFVSAYHIFVSHFIVGSPFWTLLKAEPNLRIVLLVPKGKEEFFRTNFGGENVVVEGVPRRLNRIDSLFSDFAVSALATPSIRIRRAAGLGWIFKRWSPWLFIWAPIIRPSTERVLTPMCVTSRRDNRP